MPKSSRHTIRNLDDFVTVPESEMIGCLKSFREWIARRKEQIAASQSMGTKPAVLVAPEFVWKPKAAAMVMPGKPFAADTDVRELGLRPSAMHHFRKLNLYALEDFTAVTADEIRRMPDVGAATVRYLRDQLQAIGLDFKPSDSPYDIAAAKALAARAMPIEQRRREMTDSSSIGDLCLKGFTLNRCLAKGVDTVLKLRQLTLRDLHRMFGHQTILEILSALDEVGLALATNPTQLERWHYGAISVAALKYPDEDADVNELSPWIGSLPRHFAAAGIGTVGELRALAKSGGASIRGLGESSWERVFAHFGVRRR